MHITIMYTSLLEFCKVQIYFVRMQKRWSSFSPFCFAMLGTILSSYRLVFIIVRTGLVVVGLCIEFFLTDATMELINSPACFIRALLLVTEIEREVKQKVWPSTS
jgi:hypothetical protein